LKQNIFRIVFSLVVSILAVSLCSCTGPSGLQGPAGSQPQAWEEETYTSWSIQAIYDTGVRFQTCGLDVSNDGTVYFIRVGGTYIISPAGTLENTLTDTSWFWGASPSEGPYVSDRSMTGKYKLLESTDGKTIVVLSGTSELWTRDVALDKSGYSLPPAPLGDSSAAISPSGEWIAVQVREAHPPLPSGYNKDETLIFIYKGS